MRSKARANYTTLDDLYVRLDNAVDSGELSGQEAWDEFQEIAREEREAKAELEEQEREMQSWLDKEEVENNLFW